MDRDRHALVATGGLSSAQDVYNAIAAGASFVQIFAGMIFEGPFLARRINRELVGLMSASGVESVAALRGSAGEGFNIGQSTKSHHSVKA
jgi:dihydroorotate dehydrogenase